MSELTRAEAIAKAAEFEIECPSGNKYLVRKGSPREVMTLTGEVPVEKALLPESATEEDALNTPQPVLSDEATKGLNTSRNFLERYCLDPVVVFIEHPAKGDPAKGEAAYWQVSGDVTHLVNVWVRVCMGELKPEGGSVPFRDGNGGGDSGPTGSEIRDPAAPDSEE